MAARTHVQPARYFPDAQVVELIDSNHVRIRILAMEMGLLLDDLQEPDPPIKSVAAQVRFRLRAC